MAYRLFRKMENGEKLFLGEFPSVEEAERIALEMNEHWPADYVIENTAESDGEE